MKTELPSTGYEAVDAVREAVAPDSDWDTADSEDTFLFYILRAAQNVGRFPPFTEEEAALNSWLADRMAGKRLCDYAWRIFSQS